MKVKELMTDDVEVLEPESTVEEAARAMADADIGGLPVLRDGRPVGILTDRDIVVRVVAEGLSPAETSVDAVMTADVLTCPEDADVEKAAEIMAENQVRRLVVVDDAGEFAGLVSLADLALGAGETAGDVLREISTPAEALSPGAVALLKEEADAVETYKQVG